MVRVKEALVCDHVVEETTKQAPLPGVEVSELLHNSAEPGKFKKFDVKNEKKVELINSVIVW